MQRLILTIDLAEAPRRKRLARGFRPRANGLASISHGAHPCPRVITTPAAPLSRQGGTLVTDGSVGECAVMIVVDSWDGEAPANLNGGS